MASGTVLVTGASTGIGEATALHLRELGFEPVAGVRSDEDAERLARSGLRTVKLDVTDDGQIAAVGEEIGAGALAGLVNNAGIAVAAPLEFVPLDQLRRQLEVNLIGQVAVTQALLPALRRGSLRRELRGQGVDVIVIQPGGIKTPIWKKGNALADELAERMTPEGERLYGRMIAAVRSETVKIEQVRGLPARDVAEVIGSALTSSRPRARYVIGKEARSRAVAARVLRCMAG